MSVVSTVCPNIDLNLQHRDIKLTSPSAVTVRQWISTSYSNNQATFSMPPPSQSVFIDRCFIMALPFTVTYSGTDASTILKGGYDAPRAYPVASISNSHQLTINNQTFVIQTSELIPYMARYWKDTNFSSFPSFLDNYQNYVDGVAAINNPLGQYFNALGGQVPRGGFTYSVTTNNTTTGVMTGTIYEPIWVPILHREFNDGLGLTNVRTCDLTVNFNSNLARIVSHATSTATINSVSVALGQPIVYQLYNTPPIGYVPRTLEYGAEDLNRFITPLGSALTPNSTATISSTNMQLNAIPKWILIFCRESNANLTYASTDTACNISNVSINFNNVSGILSSASEVEIFKMSKANNLQDTWEQWHGIIPNMGTPIGTSGSFMKLFFGKDITLQNGDYPGKIGAYNLQLNVTVKNVNQTTNITAPTLYVITSVPQKVIIHEGGQIEARLGVSGEDGEYVSYAHAMKHYGGSFSDWIKKGINWLKTHKVLSRVGDFVKPAVSVLAPEFTPALSAATEVARKHGFGEKKHKKGMGSGYDEEEGGRIMSREELLSRIRELR